MNKRTSKEEDERMATDETGRERNFGMNDRRPHSNLHDDQVNDPLEPLSNESRIGIDEAKRRFTRSTDASCGEGKRE